MKCINCKQKIATKSIGKPFKLIPWSCYLPDINDKTGVGPLCLKCFWLATKTGD